MPFLHVFTSARLPESRVAQALLERLSATLADQLKKPEKYVMTCLTPEAEMTFGGSSEPACYVELKNIGEFTPELTERLSARLCEMLAQGLGVAKSRIYIEFANAEPHLWGYDGQTFA
jgi:phenylpyruvate tautomerase